MAQTFDLILRGGAVALPGGVAPTDIGVRGETIVAIGDLSAASAGQTFDAKGLTVLPGVIDTQVHFREPGVEHKEDLETGSRAAGLAAVKRHSKMSRCAATASATVVLLSQAFQAAARASVRLASRTQSSLK